ncbi:MAG TPA: hypothetical protein VLF17_02490 [Candidatus Nitrosotenuis sp.]|nr:hypothetical protein [Candidatus Nitrosotenuis sp.]
MTKALFQLIIAASVLASVSLLAVNAFADTGCRRDCEAPTLGVTYEGQRIVDKGFTINGNSFDVAELTQTLPTTVVKTGQPVKIHLVVFENSGGQYLRDASLSIGNYTDDSHVNILATISFNQKFDVPLKAPLVQDSDVSQTSAVTDPNGILKDVTVKMSEVDSYRTGVDISFKVVKPIDISDIIIHTMDAKLNSKTNVFNDAISVTDKQISEVKAPAPRVPAPLKLVKSNSEVVCNEGFKLLKRSVTGAPACVSMHTAELLKSRGMATSQ